MPVISAYADHPSRPYIRVEVDWADVPAVTHARVLRYDTVTGLCIALRPYICYDGDHLLLSCGSGIFWDTEVPLDHPVYYITEGLNAPCIPADTLLYDGFGRISASGWGTPDIGNPYSFIGGVAGDYTVGSGNGTIAPTATGVDRISWSDVGTPDQDVLTTVRGFATPTGGSFSIGTIMRLTDSSNYYAGRIQVSTAGAVSAAILKRVAGVLSAVATQSFTTVDPTLDFMVRTQAWGSAVRIRAWPAGQAEPTAWLIDTIDTSLATGNGAGAYVRREAGGLTPTSGSFDTLTVSAPCVPCTPVTADTSSTPLTIANDGRFWLKDPVRPCNDRPVPLCQTGAPKLPPCEDTNGILFVGIGPEIYPANSFNLRAVNRSLSQAITRPRGGAVTALRLQTVTFTDRDDVLALAAPGSPLLFQGPSEYGVPDRYMDVKDVQVSPELPDLRIQNRTETLPYITVERPPGPTQGICGARVADICEQYSSWDELAATGFTWNDLVAGQASPVSANAARRTWDDVDAEFVDWDAVNTGGRTWNGLLEGD